MTDASVRRLSGPVRDRALACPRAARRSAAAGAPVPRPGVISPAPLCRARDHADPSGGRPGPRPCGGRRGKFQRHRRRRPRRSLYRGPDDLARTLERLAGMEALDFCEAEPRPQALLHACLGLPRDLADVARAARSRNSRPCATGERLLSLSSWCAARRRAHTEAPWKRRREAEPRRARGPCAEPGCRAGRERRAGPLPRALARATMGPRSRVGMLLETRPSEEHRGVEARDRSAASMSSSTASPTPSHGIVSPVSQTKWCVRVWRARCDCSSPCGALPPSAEGAPAPLGGRPARVSWAPAASACRAACAGSA